MSFVDRALALLYVPGCAACDARVGPGQPLCPPCATSLDPLGPACPRCALPLAGPDELTCARCRVDPPPFTAVAAPWRYGGELGTALRRLKFARRPDLARDLAPLIAPFLAAAVAAAAADVLIPVPLHWRRLVGRGFNQAHELARHARRAADLPTPLDPRLLRRWRATPPQVRLGARARAANVAGAFVVPPGQRARLAGRRVVVIDDIVTTGATLRAACRAVLDAGAAEVVGFAVARADA